MVCTPPPPQGRRGGAGRKFAPYFLGAGKFLNFRGAEASGGTDFSKGLGIFYIDEVIFYGFFFKC